MAIASASSPAGRSPRPVSATWRSWPSSGMSGPIFAPSACSARTTFLEAFADVFVQVLRLARQAGLVRLGTIAVDGTKVQGNASRHKAMSYGYMTKEVARLRAEIDELLKQAQDVDAVDEAVLGARRGDELPEDLRRRQDRLATIEAAMKRLEAEARAAADAERQRREEAEAQRQRTGTKRRGRAPGPIVDTPAEKAQTNFTE